MVVDGKWGWRTREMSGKAGRQPPLSPALGPKPTLHWEGKIGPSSAVLFNNLSCNLPRGECWRALKTALRTEIQAWGI